MGKNKIKRNIILLSGFEINDNNRGSAALGYGSIAFLKNKGFISKNDEFYMVSILDKKLWRNRNKKPFYYLRIDNNNVKINMARCFRPEYKFYLKTGFSLPFTPLGKLVRRLKLTAATNGGDGFSDIYKEPMFLNRLNECWMAMHEKVEIIMMPQTLGPFESPHLRTIADKILRYASKIYIRDDKFENELISLGVPYQKEKDLSSYMAPEPWDIDIVPNSVGINVSGLTYSNSFGNLVGQFDTYPELIDELITHFQSKGITVYLIPHSYNYSVPEQNNDDIQACKSAYLRLHNKKNVIFIDKDLKSPQIKYVISKMGFFIGTRMHANFAAIYTHVPVFGLAYSYKFAGAFESNGLSEKQTFMINNMKQAQIPALIKRIDAFYQESVK